MAKGKLKRDSEARKREVDEFRERIENGVKQFMNTEDFTNFCRTSGKLFWRGYSLRNTLGIFLQNPDASYVMGFEEWKKFGRVPIGKGTGLQILAASFPKEERKGGFFRLVRNTMEKQFSTNAVEAKKNPSVKPLEYATFPMKGTNPAIEFHGYKDNKGNMGYSVMLGGSVWVGKQDESQFRKFLDNAILGKVPTGYTLQYVFDVSSTSVPETLYVADRPNGYGKTYDEDELILDGDGNKQFNHRGQVLIRNSDERKARFRTDLDTDVPKHDERKMEILFDVLKTLSGRGITHITGTDGKPVKGEDGKPVPYRVPISVDAIEEEGCKGFFHRIDDKIVISDELDATNRVAVAFHEIGHSIFHKDFERFKEVMEKEAGTSDVGRSMREVQAEAFACQAAGVFGIDTDTGSFAYIGRWSKGLEMTELKASLDLVWRESKKLLNSIERELESKGFNMKIEPLDTSPLTKQQLHSICSKFSVRILELSGFSDSVLQNCKSVKPLLEDKISLDIKGEQEALAFKIKEEVATSIRLIGELENETSKLEQLRLKMFVEKSLERADSYREKVDGREYGLSREFVERSNELDSSGKSTLRERYVSNPIPTLKEIAREFPSLQDLSDSDLKFISKSNYINSNLVRFLGSETSRFVDFALNHLGNAKSVSSKNGAFVEINSCGVWHSNDDMRNIIKAGMLLHPKMANQVFKQAEGLVEQGKRDGLVKADYVCKLTVFAPYDGKKGNSVLGVKETAVHIGDGRHKDLKEHMSAVCNRGSSNKAILEVFSKAVSERKIPNEKSVLPNDVERDVGDSLASPNLGEDLSNVQGKVFSLDEADSLSEIRKTMLSASPMKENPLVTKFEPSQDEGLV